MLLVNFAKNRNDANIGVTITDVQAHTKIYYAISKYKGKERKNCHHTAWNLKCAFKQNKQYLFQCKNDSADDDDFRTSDQLYTSALLSFLRLN